MFARVIEDLGHAAAYVTGAGLANRFLAAPPAPRLGGGPGGGPRNS